MESYALDMGDIFHTEADLDDDLAVPPPMPDLDDGIETLNEVNDDADGEDGTDADVLSKLKDLSKGAAKKKVMKPQPKLNLERLKSARGLAALPKLFESVKFKGKGHEADDLGVLMGKLEHWAHRLYPKHPFGDFVERLEKLGTMKSVQTCIKRIRLDIEDEDVLRIGGSDEEQEDTTVRGVKEALATGSTTELDAEAAYEEMIREEREIAEKRKDKDTPLNNSQVDDMPSTSQSDKGLTEEQIARMERNRHLALERRMARLANNSQNEQATEPESDQKVDSVELDLHLTDTGNSNTIDTADSENTLLRISNISQTLESNVIEDSEELDLQMSETMRNTNPETTEDSLKLRLSESEMVNTELGLNDDVKHEDITGEKMPHVDVNENGIEDYLCWQEKYS